MGAITLLTSGDQGQAGFGPALDVSASAQLRLTFTTTTARLPGVTLEVVLETSTDGSAWRLLEPWGTILDGRGDTSAWPSSQRRVFDRFDKYVRARWVVRGQVNPFPIGGGGDGLKTVNAPSIVWGIAGEVP